MSRRILHIPTDGPVQHVDNYPSNGLDSFIGPGALVSFDLRVDGEHIGGLLFVAPPVRAEFVVNERAQRLLVHLTKTHMRITGDAWFVDVDEALVTACGVL